MASDAWFGSMTPPEPMRIELVTEAMCASSTAGAEEAGKRGCFLADIDLMDDVRAYNEVDCRVMMEAIHYLRAHH